MSSKKPHTEEQEPPPSTDESDESTDSADEEQQSRFSRAHHEAQKLRDAIDRYCSEEGISRPEFLIRIGVDKDNSFDARKQSLHRFGQKGALHLDQHVYVKAVSFFRKKYDEFDLDPLNENAYADKIALCKGFHESMMKFYNIREDRFLEVKRQAAGRFLLYKLPVNPFNRHLILRSYLHIFEAEPRAKGHKFMMAIEYQKEIYKSEELGVDQIDRDYYVGCCIIKDASLILMLRQLYNGAMKTIYFNTITVDHPDIKMSRAYGETIETCDGYSPVRLVGSKTAIRRIPDSFTFDDIDPLIDGVPREAVDEIFADHVLGKKE